MIRIFVAVQCGRCDSRSSHCVEHGKYNYTCECRQGYRKDSAGSCGDVDECAEGSHDCAPRAWCVNTQGNFKCSCMAGYKGDGRQCILVGLGILLLIPPGRPWGMERIGG